MGNTDDNTDQSKPSKQQTVMQVGIVVLLIAQACSYVLFRQHLQTSGMHFDSNMILLVGEVEKMLFSAWMLLVVERDDTQPPKSYFEILENGKVMIIPAVLYMVTNLLSFFSLQHISGALFITVNQLKILTTALFSVLILKVHLSFAKWVSLVLLVIGSTIVTQQEHQHSHSAEHEKESEYFYWGVMAVLLQVTITGLIGAYYEKILKFSKGSVWERNLQLAFLSSFFYVANYMWASQVSIIEELLTWDWFTFFIATLGAAGGVLVALCTKYLNSVVKCVVLSFSVLLTVLLAHVFFGSVLTVGTFVGAVFVIGGSLLYSQPDWLDRFLQQEK